MKRSPLKSDPEKTREFHRRGQALSARTLRPKPVIAGQTALVFETKYGELPTRRGEYPPRDEIERLYAELHYVGALAKHYHRSHRWAKAALAHHDIPAVRPTTRVAIVCAHCGKQFETYASAIQAGKRFCSLACRSTSQRTRRRSQAGKKPWGVKIKGEDRCRNCGAPAVHLHHIVPRSKSRKGRDDVIANGLPLCSTCHMGWHSRAVTIQHDRLTDIEFACAVELGGALLVEHNYPDHGDVALMRLDELVNRRVLRANRPETIDERMGRLAGLRWEPTI